MPETLNVGDRIRLHFTDTTGQPEDVTVCSTLTNEQEGLGPEIDDFIACWIEVSRDKCESGGARLSISLGTDLHYELDGRPLTIEKLES